MNFFNCVRNNINSHKNRQSGSVMNILVRTHFMHRCNVENVSKLRTPDSRVQKNVIKNIETEKMVRSYQRRNS